MCWNCSSFFRWEVVLKSLIALCERQAICPTMKVSLAMHVERAHSLRILQSCLEVGDVQPMNENPQHLVILIACNGSDTA